MLNKDFHYQGFISVQEGKLIIHDTQWTLRKPTFHPEDHSDKSQMVMAIFDDQMPPDGHYSLSANGDIVFKDGMSETFEVQVLLENYAHGPVEEHVIRRWTHPQPQRPVYVDVEFAQKPAT